MAKPHLDGHVDMNFDDNGDARGGEVDDYLATLLEYCFALPFAEGIGTAHLDAGSGKAGWGLHLQWLPGQGMAGRISAVLWVRLPRHGVGIQ